MRHWNNLKTEDNSVHCLGNGKMGVYEEGPDIFQIFGPPYSSPTFIKILIDEASKLETDSERIKGTAIWKHHIVKNDIHVGEFTDFVHHDINCFIRQLVLEETVSFMLSTDEKTKVVHNKKRFDQYDVEEAFLFTIEAGAPIYNTYPSIASTSFQVILKGENIHINQHHIDHAWSITIGAGESFIYVMGGPSYPECMKLPSREDGAITVGYDYGLLLYALTKLKHPMAEEFYVKTLSVIDPTGAWVEYYENGMPKSTRYRPFESAINIEALIQYSLS